MLELFLILNGYPPDERPENGPRDGVKSRRWQLEAKSEMPDIYANIAVTLDSSDDNQKELIAEYERSLGEQRVTPKAADLTHQICMQVRSALDRLAFRYWALRIAPSLPEAEKKAAKSRIYFPAGPTLDSLKSTLGGWGWKHVKDQHQALFEYLLSKQPFSSADNRWLSVLFDLAVQGKHIDLVPQTRVEERRITVSAAAGSVSWGPGVTFGGPPGSVQVMGATIDPKTQRIVPTPGVEERIETWISFLIQGHDVNAAGFCSDACKKARQIAQEMTDKFGLS